MTDSNFVDPNTDDLDAFSSLLDGSAKPIEAVEEQEVPQESVDDINPVATEAEEATPEEDPLATDDEPTSEDDEVEDTPDEEQAPSLAGKKKNKVPAKERIAELVTKLREAERKLEALEKPTTPEPARTAPLESDVPDPDALNEDGSNVYPLGEFDPLYIRDLTRHTIQKERDAARQEEAQEREQRAHQEAQTRLAAEWEVKLEEAESRIPDLRSKIVELEEDFVGLDPAYGEYLATTIMAMDRGLDVLNYLADNRQEAFRITRLGPAAATLALGRLEARFEEKREAPRPKTTGAPPPPPPNKGTTSTIPIAADTDSLEDFERLLFKKAR